MESAYRHMENRMLESSFLANAMDLSGMAVPVKGGPTLQPAHTSAGSVDAVSSTF